jgi:hypothetical protein
MYYALQRTIGHKIINFQSILVIYDIHVHHFQAFEMKNLQMAITSDMRHGVMEPVTFINSLTAGACCRGSPKIKQTHGSSAAMVKLS